MNMNPEFNIRTDVSLNQPILTILKDEYMHPSEYDDISAMGQRALATRDQLPLEDRVNFSFYDFFISKGLNDRQIRDYNEITIKEMYLV